MHSDFDYRSNNNPTIAFLEKGMKKNIKIETADNFDTHHSVINGIPNMVGGPQKNVLHLGTMTPNS